MQNAVAQYKTVADPSALYESILPTWKRNRAVCAGERFVKQVDEELGPHPLKNLLLPFSPSMTLDQYYFYLAEAEFPGITAQYIRTLVGALLRKNPTVELPAELPPEIKTWITEMFGEDDSNLAAFLDGALNEELVTSRCWIQVDYPRVENPEVLTREEILELKPYPIIWKAENIINHTVGVDKHGKRQLQRVIIRKMEEDFSMNEFHPVYVDYVDVHELNEEGVYQIRHYRRASPASDANVKDGKLQTDFDKRSGGVEELGVTQGFMFQGMPLDFIPIWPFNGAYDIQEPLITPIVNREVALYNKISRRNHLLYGTATYTPVISADISEERFAEIVDSGLGTWILLPENGKADVLRTPSEALEDMDRAIAAHIEEMAKLGIRMLTPEVSQSGVALDIRNATQSAQIGTLNMKCSAVMADIIAFMINWRYGTQLNAGHVKFTMSSDFTPMARGEEWLRLATEWYEAGFIPRSSWLFILKHNDMLDPSYDDEIGKQEIIHDDMVINKQEQQHFENTMYASGM